MSRQQLTACRTMLTLVNIGSSFMCVSQQSQANAYRKLLRTRFLGHHLLSGQVEGAHQPCEHQPHGHIPPHATPLDATCATDGPFPPLYTTLPQAPSSSALQPQESPQVQESRRPLFRQPATSVSQAAGLQRLAFTNSMNLALHPLHHSDQSCAVMPLNQRERSQVRPPCSVPLLRQQAALGEASHDRRAHAQPHHRHHQ